MYVRGSYHFACVRANMWICACVHVCTFFFPFCGSSKCITHPLNNRRSIAKTTMFSQHTHTSRFSLYLSSLSHCMRFFSFTYFLSSAVLAVCARRTYAFGFCCFVCEMPQVTALLCIHYENRSSLFHLYSWHSLLCWCVVSYTHRTHYLIFNSTWSEHCTVDREKEREKWLQQQQCHNENVITTHRVRKETHSHEYISKYHVKWGIIFHIVNTYTLTLWLWLFTMGIRD